MQVQETSYGVASSMCASARNVNIPTPPHPNPEKRALDEKKEEKQQIPMVGGYTRTRADRHPEGTTRGPFCIVGKYTIRHTLSVWVGKILHPKNPIPKKVKGGLFGGGTP